MNFFAFYISFLFINSAIFIPTNEKLATINTNKYTKIYIKNQKNEVLKDSIHFSDSLISIELIAETSLKYEIQEIEIIVAEERGMLGRELYFNVKSGDTLNIGRCLQKLINRRKKLQQELNEITNLDIVVDPKSLRIVIELKNCMKIDNLSGQKSQILEWSRGKITTLYCE